MKHPKKKKNRRGRRIGKEERVMINPKNIEKSPNHRNADKNEKILSKALMANEEC